MTESDNLKLLAGCGDDGVLVGAGFVVNLFCSLESTRVVVSLGNGDIPVVTFYELIDGSLSFGMLRWAYDSSGGVSVSAVGLK